MRRTAVGVFMFASLSFAVGALAADRPDWAFPVTDKAPPATLPDDGKPKSAPGSDRSYTRAQIEDLYNPPDWYPGIHPAMPAVVAHGEAPNVRACAACHLPTGTGHTESANVAGMPAAYLLQQMEDYKTGARKGSGSMLAIAKAISDEGNKASAAYFASLKPRVWIRVVEAETVPKTYIAGGNKRVIHPDHVFEPLGARIIELAEDENRLLNRDPGSGFVAFVPKGSVEKGRARASGRATGLRILPRREQSRHEGLAGAGGTHAHLSRAAIVHDPERRACGGQCRAHESHRRQTHHRRHAEHGGLFRFAGTLIQPPGRTR